MNHLLPGPYEQQQALFDAIARRHYAVGLVSAPDVLTGYQALVLPSFVKVDPELNQRLRDYVEGGGILLATAQLGTRDENNHKIATTPPGDDLGSLFGLEVIEWGRTVDGPVAVGFSDEPGPAPVIYEIPELAGAEAIVSWQSTRAIGVGHQAAGHAALTRNRIGQGQAWYFASLAVDDTADALVDFLADQWSVSPLASAHPEVEVTVRETDATAFCFVLNHSTESRKVSSLPPGTDLLTEMETDGSIELAAYGVAVIKV